MTDFSTQLSKYIPTEAAPIISRWINDTNCRFKITRSRSSKLGDYRAPYRGNTHQITVNHDLNRFSFLITTIHEFAHLRTWQEHKHRVKPHGTEWKENFKVMMQPFLKLNIFPNDVVLAVSNYMSNPAASSCTDLQLYRVLKNYDLLDSPVHTVEELPENSIFQLKNGRTFQKKEKLRKRYKCIEIDTNKIYLFHPIAEVTPLNANI
ncbi:SprT family zinc-dependent metalloprotease [Sphingobacterium alkalisoli]|uniref:SprT family zinc-dependent metalloprotease n=1 Tax=Sphingobacterium alkalisoli TaxID=1874115 RepID=A0A4U0GPY4_9SPHI|nr:SprT-like domain-containing protein [Sphingobacterium alkalisoli]TJY60716.1 SprT family zinc-dependent metalloprotease [Sphingobacterium alkalisoli]GGH31522.1 hypothetical protein GCM10011418_44390 [Sphingobacterium alkalisoli]